MDDFSHRFHKVFDLLCWDDNVEREREKEEGEVCMEKEGESLIFLGGQVLREFSFHSLFHFALPFSPLASFSF